MHATTIIGYTYATENYTPSGVIEALIREGRLPISARAFDTEDILHAFADRAGIDWSDEHSYDSSEFPKVIFADSIQEGETFLDSDGSYVDPLD